MAQIEVIPTPSSLLAKFPCTSSQCLSMHEQLAVLIALLLAMLTPETTVDQLEYYTRKTRNMSKTDMLQGLIAAFSDEFMESVDQGAAAAQVACLKCYSDQKLIEMILFLIGDLINSYESVQAET